MTKLRFCLINPPQANSLDDRLDAPLGLLYVAASVREMGIPVRIADLSSERRERWEGIIGDADIYGIGIYTCNYYISREIRDICRKINPGAPVIAGGAHPTAMPEETLKDFDVVLRGEADISIKKFIGDLGRGIHRKMYDFEPPPDLDELPLPARDLVDIKSYHRIVGGGLATSIITSRGCPYRCAFCNSPGTFRSIKYRSSDSVIAEIEGIIKDHGIRNFIFYDDVFTLNRDRLYPFLERLESLNIKFRCNGRADYNRFEDFVRLKRAGCTTIAFGAETGDQGLLDRIQKDCTVEQNHAVIREAKRAGLIAKIYLIVGIPGETEDTIERTKQFIMKADPDEYTLFTLIPLPGSALWNERERFGIRFITKDYNEFYNIAGQGDGGMTIETDSYTMDKLKSMREDLKAFLASRTWRGDVQRYFQKIEWR
ncbi:MAG: radical SAM protein [Candidatus Omnitrophota bacterium]